MISWEIKLKEMENKLFYYQKSFFNFDLNK